jgi:hypothetical protein
MYCHMLARYSGAGSIGLIIRQGLAVLLPLVICWMIVSAILSGVAAQNSTSGATIIEHTGPVRTMPSPPLVAGGVRMDMRWRCLAAVRPFTRLRTPLLLAMCGDACPVL